MIIKFPRHSKIDLAVFDMPDDQLEVRYGMPREVVYCRRCVTPNQRPNSTKEYAHWKGSKHATVIFDDEGVCDACRVAEMKHETIDWDAREQELTELCDRFRKDDGQYDCLIHGSGGKDSFVVSHLLKTKFGDHRGFGLIPGRVGAIPAQGSDGTPHKIPHIGWNRLAAPEGGNAWGGTILDGIEPGASVYFVHSFTPNPKDAGHRLADTDYDGCRVSAVLRRDNAYGCQFHCEKSGPVGLKIIENFLKL